MQQSTSFLCIRAIACTYNVDIQKYSRNNQEYKKMCIISTLLNTSLIDVKKLTQNSYIATMEGGRLISQNMVLHNLKCLYPRI